MYNYKIFNKILVNTQNEKFSIHAIQGTTLRKQLLFYATCLHNINLIWN